MDNQTSLYSTIAWLVSPHPYAILRQRNPTGTTSPLFHRLDTKTAQDGAGDIVDVGDELLHIVPIRDHAHFQKTLLVAALRRSCDIDQIGAMDNGLRAPGKQ